jgi:hypothetical protein
MGETANKQGPDFVSVTLPDAQAILEKIQYQENGNKLIRLSLTSKSQRLSEPFELQEFELVLLLQRAIKAGILSPDFVKNLGAEFEI